MTAALVLASASPRRRELLAQLGVPFEVLPSEVPEEPLAGESPEAFAARVAREKADEVAAQRPAAWVLAADTVVTIEGRILGKPADAIDARRMLRELSGRTHRVLTAVTLRSPSRQRSEDLLCATAVTMRPLSDREIEQYLDSGEPFDKAGGYGIQGRASPFIAAVNGSYTNVVGLPLDEVRALLERHDLLATRPDSPA
ncbi:MAG: septum formation inhibitor Maf [Deltaproteobacteria bacterium]|nr:septum formation inhibitor Maf [Deltaproteobacteria bacterium]MBI3388863.1 septum formation inhibitor Maf [Deltaproteobacteria bacterium]